MSPSENIQYDFEWRPLNNYLAVQRITPPDMRQGSAAEPRLPSEALYEWIVLNGRSPLEGLSLGSTIAFPTTASPGWHCRVPAPSAKPCN
ncbi:hypothetical protein [Pseudomonas aeruginosa]|uniref:hypothetical protein n=1 Tax=Pseudomonas aeruginosa TaxID=287 RepID=UPI000AC5B600|nr:hypothetical protein [Pseudomonas aeruginosa]